MSAEPTTAVVQRYLDALAGDAPAEPIIRALVDQSVRRLQLVSRNLLYRGYPRLMQPPLNLEPELSSDGRRIFEAIENLPEEEREVFSLVRIQGLAHNEAAGVLGVAIKTVRRRLNRAVLLLAEQLDDLRPT